MGGLKQELNIKKHPVYARKFVKKNGAKKCGKEYDAQIISSKSINSNQVKANQFTCNSFKGMPSKHKRPIW
jgi:hypothetical protein